MSTQYKDIIENAVDPITKAFWMGVMTGHDIANNKVPTYTPDKIERLPLQVTKEAQLEAISKRIGSCGDCPLHTAANKPACSEGNIRARLFVLLDKSPTSEERVLLEKILHDGKVLDLHKKDIFITVAAKCTTQLPEQKNLLKCSVHTQRLLYLVNPIAVLVIGASALQQLTPPITGVHKVLEKLADTQYYMYGWKVFVIEPLSAMIDANPTSKASKKASFEVLTKLKTSLETKDEGQL